MDNNIFQNLSSCGFRKSEIEEILNKNSLKIGDGEYCLDGNTLKYFFNGKFIKEIDLNYCMA